MQKMQERQQFLIVIFGKLHKVVLGYGQSERLFGIKSHVPSLCTHACLQGHSWYNLAFDTTISQNLIYHIW